MSIIHVQKQKIDFPMSRERYLSTWKTFRKISNENEITAKHIVNLNTWNNINSILDLGCGDGLIAKSIINLSASLIDKITLVDPDSEMLEEAYRNVVSEAKSAEVKKDNSPLEECYETYVYDADVILAIHLVYLIRPEVFHYIIDSLPRDKKLIFVLDDHESIFTKLWERTAPKYVERSNYVRGFLESAPKGLSVTKSIIISEFQNPLKQAEVSKDALLSLMSYSDYALMNQESKMFVEDCILNNLVDDKIECLSACYEVTRT